MIGRNRVGVVGGLDALHDHGHALQAHAGIDGRARQRLHCPTVELHEHIVPDLDIVGVVAVHAGGAHLAQVVAQIHRDLRARAARAGIAHHPEVILLAEAQHSARVGAGLDPQLLGLYVGRQAQLVVAGEDREPQPLDRQLELLGQQIPGHRDRLGLEIIAERKVAQHLKERLVARRRADLFEIVVLARDAHALLGGGGARVGPLLQAQKGILERHHARVGKQQRRIVAGYQRRARHDRMTASFKELEIALADLRARQIFHDRALKPDSYAGSNSGIVRHSGAKRQLLTRRAGERHANR